MRDSVSYENSLGTTIDLNDGNYFTDTVALRAFSWDASVSGRPDGYGAQVKKLARQSQTFKLTIGARGTKAQFDALMNALHALTEVDALTKRNGYLWFNGQYLPCFLTVSSTAKYSREGRFAQKQVTIMSPDPFWVTETTQDFYPVTGSISGGKKYNLRYPYRYGTGYGNEILYNSHYADTPMVLTFYGATTDPEVTIAGHSYAITATLAAGERVEIDQLNHTIIKIGSTGVQTNLFNARDKTSDIFQPVPAGNQTVLYYGDTAFRVTLLKRRSEPEWI